MTRVKTSQWPKCSEILISCMAVTDGSEHIAAFGATAKPMPLVLGDPKKLTTSSITVGILHGHACSAFLG